jgi:hypothetical protein
MGISVPKRFSEVERKKKEPRQSHHLYKKSNFSDFGPKIQKPRSMMESGFFRKMALEWRNLNFSFHDAE